MTAFDCLEIEKYMHVKIYHLSLFITIRMGVNIVNNYYLNIHVSIV